MRNLSILSSIVLLCSCVVWPDPYRMEVYCPEDNLSSRSDANLSDSASSPYLIGGDFLSIWVQGSGYSKDDEYPPYRIQFWLYPGSAKFETVEVRGFSVSHNQVQISDASLFDPRTEQKIDIPGPVPTIFPMPCCRAWFLSSWLDIPHVPGDTISVKIDVTVGGADHNFSKSVERTFVAKVHKGIIQVDGLTGEKCS